MERGVEEEEKLLKVRSERGGLGAAIDSSATQVGSVQSRRTQFHMLH